VSEIEVINLYLQRKLESKIWINHPKFSAITKIEQLRLASEIGLKIPETCVSSSSSTILDKFGGISKVITKPIANYLEFVDEDKHYITYSQRCNMKYGEHFFPSLFQRLIERAYELRVFVFQEHIFPMMIFCDEDNDNIDIRYKNYEKRTTYSSCSLSENLSQSLLLFMKKSQIQTGSFDLIVDQIGDTYFIEINPFGQFDFVSQNCNYQIEKHIACKLYEEYKKTL
jgi:glutathione synthase/RimK-type ligase-like ATP-grasp enzyme